MDPMGLDTWGIVIDHRSTGKFIADHLCCHTLPVAGVLSFSSPETCSRRCPRNQLPNLQHLEGSVFSLLLRARRSVMDGWDDLGGSHGVRSLVSPECY